MWELVQEYVEYDCGDEFPSVVQASVLFEGPWVDLEAAEDDGEC